MTEQADMPFGQLPVDCFNYFLSVHQPIYRELPACCHSHHYVIWIRYITSHMLVSVTRGIAMRKATDPNSFGSMLGLLCQIIRMRGLANKSPCKPWGKPCPHSTPGTFIQNSPSGGTCVWRFNGLLFLFSSVFWKIRWNHLLISLDSCSFLPIFSPLSASNGFLMIWAH